MEKLLLLDSGDFGKVDTQSKVEISTTRSFSWVSAGHHHSAEATFQVPSPTPTANGSYVLQDSGPHSTSSFT